MAKVAWVMWAAWLYVRQVTVAKQNVDTCALTQHSRLAIWDEQIWSANSSMTYFCGRTRAIHAIDFGSILQWTTWNRIRYEAICIRFEYFTIFDPMNPCSGSFSTSSTSAKIAIYTNMDWRRWWNRLVDRSGNDCQGIMFSTIDRLCIKTITCSALPLPSRKKMKSINLRSRHRTVSPGCTHTWAPWRINTAIHFRAKRSAKVWWAAPQRQVAGSLSIRWFSSFFFSCSKIANWNCLQSTGCPSRLASAQRISFESSWCWLDRIQVNRSHRLCAKDCWSFYWDRIPLRWFCERISFSKLCRWWIRTVFSWAIIDAI